MTILSSQTARAPVAGPAGGESLRLAMHTCFSHWLAMRERIAGGTIYPPQRPAGVYLLLTASGYARATCDDRTVDHAPGSIVVLLGGGELFETVGPDADWVVSYMRLEGDLPSAFARQMRGRGMHRLTALRTAPRHHVTLLQQAIDLTFNQPPGWDYAALAAISELFMLLLFDNTPAAHRPLASQIMRLVEADPYRMWSVRDVADALGVSASQVAHCFKAETGTTPAAWMRTLRMNTAARHLEQGESVKTVAERMGYAYPSQFSRVFKEVTGMPPSTRRACIDASLHAGEHGHAPARGAGGA